MFLQEYVLPFPVRKTIQPLLLLLLFLPVLCMNGNSIPLPAWADEFNLDGSPDAAIWSNDIGGHGWGNNELQYYTDGLNTNVGSGILKIIAKKEVYSGKDYTSARMITKNKGDWLYGRFEVKAKLPKGRGSWPAIWMLPTDWAYGNWPNSGEIDIMDHVGYDQKEVDYVRVFTFIR